MTKISNYEVVADNIEELTSYVNDHNKFTNIMRNDLSWFTDLGFISCELYSDDDYSRNYYKVIGNEILMLHLRTQDIKEGKFGIRKRLGCLITKRFSDVLTHLNHLIIYYMEKTIIIILFLVMILTIQVLYLISLLELKTLIINLMV